MTKATQDTQTPAEVAEQSAKSTNIDLVTEAFIKEIRERGILHTFEWASGWFDRVATAAVEDHVQSYLGDMAGNKDAVNLLMLDEFSRMAESVSNQSTSESANMMRRSRMAAMAKMFNRNYGAFGAGKAREKAWDDVRAKCQAKAAAEASKG